MPTPKKSGDLFFARMKLLRRILVAILSLFAALGVSTGLAALTMQLPQPIGIILTFLGWVGVGILWQELLRRYNR